MMMREAALANLFAFAAALGAVAVVWRTLVLPNFRDSLRHSLFQLRHEMFMFMANGGVAADAPAYGHLRSSMNGWIRFANNMSFSRMVLLMITARAELNARAARFESHLSLLPPDARQTLRGFQRKAGKATLKHLLASSPLAWVLLPLILVCSVIGVLVTQAWSHAWDATFARIGVEGEVVGGLECEPKTVAA